MILEIVFTGICAFTQTKSGFAAVMPDADDHPRHRHVTWMIVEKDLLPRARFDREDNDEKCVPRGALILPRGELKVAGTRIGSLKFSGPKTANKEPSKADEHSIRWVAKAPDFLQTTPQLKPEYGSAAGSKVALWFDLPAGRLTAHGVGGCVWEMRRPNKEEVISTQALAQEVVWRGEIPNRDTLDVKVGQVTYHLNVKNKSTVRLTFGNTMGNDIFPAKDELEPSDPHFDIYYDMFAGGEYTKPENRPIPHRSGTAKCRIPDAKDCPPARGVAKETYSEVVRKRIGGANCPPMFLFQPVLTEEATKKAGR